MLANLTSHFPLDGVFRKRSTLLRVLGGQAAQESRAKTYFPRALVGNHLQRV